jgi:hypothetical protein
MTMRERLVDLKNSNPVEVAEYAVTQKIEHDLTFEWWVPYTLKMRDRVIAAVSSKRVPKRNQKFGIRVPMPVDDATKVDVANGNTLWQDAICKEMEAVKVAFKVLGEEDYVPPGHQFIRCHIIFGVKMEDFRRKACYVAGGHTTKAPASLMYASAVSRESVRITLTLAALNDLEVKAADIKNAYMTAPVNEIIWTQCSSEF